MRNDSLVVYVVDPDRAIGEGLATLLNTYAIRVQCYPDGESFLEALPRDNGGRACLVAEADLPGLSGPALLHRLRRAGRHLPVLLLLSTATPEIIRQVQTAEGIDVIEKPMLDGELVDKILRLMYRETPPLPVGAHN